MIINTSAINVQYIRRNQKCEHLNYIIVETCNQCDQMNELLLRNSHYVPKHNYYLKTSLQITEIILDPQCQLTLILRL